MRRSFYRLAMLVLLRNSSRLSWRRITFGVITLLILCIYYLFLIDHFLIIGIHIPRINLHHTKCPDVHEEIPNLSEESSKPPVYPSVYESPLTFFYKSHGQNRPVKIPHIIHQMYKTRRIPSAFSRFVKSWSHFQPGWQYVFWTDADIDIFIKNYYPAFKDLFKDLPNKYMNSPFAPIYRSDLVRYLILDFFGGVYADLDTECIQSIDTLTRDHYVVVSREPEAFALSSGRDTIVQACNAFMMSAPGHPVWSTVLETIQERVKDTPLDPVQTTGPVALDLALRRYRCRKPWTRQRETSVYLAPSPIFYSRMPWMESRERVHAISRVCSWLRFVGIKTPQVHHICKEAQKNHRVDWSFVPKISPSDRYVLHHGSQVYAVDRMHASQDNGIDVASLVPNVISFQKLFESDGRIKRSFVPVKFP